MSTEQPNPEMTLVVTALEALVPTIDEASEGERGSDDPGPWAEIERVLAHHGVKADADTELDEAVVLHDGAALKAIVDGWTSGKRLLLERDRGVLKRALKAYRKRLKVTLLDAESSVSGGPMSAGRESNIVGIVPPERYPREVWDTLVRQKKLVDRGRGTYELAPGA